MPTFPSGLYTHITLVDNDDDVLAAHPNALGGEIEVIEAKIGVDSSAVATSLDYFLKHASGAYRNHIHDGSSDDGANIPNASLTQITTAGKVSGAALTLLASIPAGAGAIPATNCSVNFVIKSITKETTDAAGDTAYTGFGFQPRGVIIFSMGGSNTCQGFDDATTHVCTMQYDTPGITYSTDPNFSINLDTGGTIGMKGIVKSMDANGITITWSKTGAPSFQIIARILAFK